MSKIAVFASGSGTNAENIIQYFLTNQNIEIVSLFCNNPDAYVLKRVEKYNIAIHIFDRETFKSPNGVLKNLREENIDFIVLAGFLWLIPELIVNEFPDNIINIHPALMPDFCGKGMFGNHVHQAVIDAGRQESGISIHFVNSHYDQGSIIFQAKCPVLPNDTAESLAERVHALEYKYYPEIIEQVINKK